MAFSLMEFPFFVLRPLNLSIHPLKGLNCCCVLVACLFLMCQLTVQGNWVAYAQPSVCRVLPSVPPICVCVRVCVWSFVFLWSTVCLMFVKLDQYLCVFVGTRYLVLFSTLALPRCPLVIGRARVSSAPPTGYSACALVLSKWMPSEKWEVLSCFG